MTQFRKSQYFRVLAGIFLTVSTVAALTSCHPGAPDSSLLIYGGTPVPRDRHRSVVAIHESSKVICTGTLIHPSVVLTAGHCIASGDGQTRITGISDGPGRDGGARKAETGISDSVVHPDFKAHPRGNMDVGLLFLATPLETSGPASPAAATAFIEDNAANVRALLALLPAPDHTVIIAPILTMVGYGRREDGRSGKKFAVDVPVTQSNPSEIALGGSGKDSCDGDSGGPVLDTAGRLVAVISRGLTIGCGNGGIATVVADASCWIREEAMNRGFEIPVSQPCGDPARQAESLKTALSATGTKTGGTDGTTVDLSGWYLESIAMLQDLVPDATSVNLKGNHLTDVRELLWLPRLRHVDLSFNNIPADDIHELERKGIAVRGANLQISTFLATPFYEACSRLDQASLTDDEKIQIKALRARFASSDCATINARLVKTLRLQLAARDLKSVSLLAGLPLLEHLDLSGNPLETLIPLLDIENLKSLRIAGVPQAVLEQDHGVLDIIRSRGVQVVTGSAPDATTN